jgi:hypothetical protein
MKRLIISALAVAACGDVVFVDPDQPLKDSLKIERAERLVVADDPRVYFHVRVASRRAIERVSLTVSGPSGAWRLPLEDAHTQRCGDRETCISLSLQPGLPLDADTMRLDLAAIGHHHEAPVTTRSLGRVILDGAAEAANTRVAVTVRDPIREYYSSVELVRELDDDGELITESRTVLFPRAFEVEVRAGPCGLPAEASASGWVAAVGNPFTQHAEFSSGERPEACASVRPAAPAGGGGVAARTIGARALVTRFTHTYVPPIEIAPLVVQLFFDLELPNAERCSAAQELVRTAILEAAVDIAASRGQGAEILLLDSVQLAVANGTPCRQAADRSFDAEATFEAIQAQLRAAFGPSRRVRIVSVYVSNLDLDLPASLSASFDRLEGVHREADVGALKVAIAPSQPALRLRPERLLPWLATEDPTFRAVIRDLFREIWPFRTVVHTDATVVPLVSSEERERFSAFRVCSASSARAFAVGTRVGGRTVFQPLGEGPAYSVALSPLVLIEAVAFQQPSVIVDWEGCAGLCDHPPPGGNSDTPWERTEGCR